MAGAHWAGHVFAVHHRHGETLKKVLIVLFFLSAFSLRAEPVRVWISVEGLIPLHSYWLDIYAENSQNTVLTGGPLESPDSGRLVRCYSFEWDSEIESYFFFTLWDAEGYEVGINDFYAVLNEPRIVQFYGVSVFLYVEPVTPSAPDQSEILAASLLDLSQLSVGLVMFLIFGLSMGRGM